METFVNGLMAAAHGGLQYAVNSIGLGIAAAGAGWLVLHYSKRLNAATRYVTWWAALVIVVVLPLASGLLPKLSPSDLAAAFAAVAQPSADEQAMPIFTGELADRDAPGGGNSGDHRAMPWLEGRIADIPEYTVGAVDISGLKADLAGAAGETVTEKALGTVLVALLPAWFFLLLLLGAVIMLVRLAWGSLRLRMIKLHSFPLDENSHRVFERLAGAVGLRRRVVLRCSLEVAMPMAAGFFRPMIIVPAGLERHISHGEFEAVILHELAHVRRRDDWSKLVQKILEAVFFFNPALRWIGHRLDFEREVACDGWVVSHTGQPRNYARCLARLVQLSSPAQSITLAPGAMMPRKQIFRRFEMLLSQRRSTEDRFYRRRFVVAAGLIAAVACMCGLVFPSIALPQHGLTYADISATISNEIFGEDAPVVGAESAEALTLTEIHSETRRVQQDSYITQTETHHSIENATFDGGTPGPAISESRRARAAADTRDAESARSAATSDYVLALADVDEADDWDIVDDAVEAVTDVFDEFSNGTQIITDGKGITTFRWSDGKSRLQVEMKGEIEFSDDDRSISSISKRGYIDIEEKTRTSKRELEITPARGGGFEYKYYVNRKEQKFDDEGQAWLADILIKLIRSTGVGAESRVERILAKGGVDAVLTEIDLIESSYVKREYYEALMDVADLSADDFSRIIKKAASDIDSDYEKAELLIRIARQSSSDAGLLPAYVDAVKTLESDYETRRVLSAFSMGDDVEKTVIVDVLDIADGMSSDYFKAELLIDMAPYSRDDKELRDAYVTAVKKLESDYETRRVLTALGTRRNIDAGVMTDLLEIAGGMDSDYEKAELLIDLADFNGYDTDLTTLYFNAATSIESDYEIRRVLSAFGYGDNVDEVIISRILKVAQRMESDYELAEVLKDLVEYAARNKGLQEAYLGAAKRIDSDYEKAGVIKKLVDRAELDDETVRAILLLSAELDSDYEKGRLLEELIPHCRDNPELEDALVDVIETMDSDYERDQMYAKLYKRAREYRGTGH
ncbi:MAG: M56 family metallopeptidase [candidate division Zixibacteria bacterium]|nr:M56 family metallopeptidase [candidate division Zixibacteria bacterium]